MNGDQNTVTGQDMAVFFDDALESARKLFMGPCDFVLGVQNLSQLPSDALPEIAFAGRSNVGKSSLINALTGRKALARTSNTPGRTQQLNFFKLGDIGHLVDMPGYGYAKVSKSMVADWTKLLKSYLRGRVNLRLACVLIDGRHGPKDTDIEMMKMLDQAAVPYRIVLTKCDKPKKAELDTLIADLAKILKKHPAAFPDPILTSSEKGTGIEGLRAMLAQALKF